MCAVSLFCALQGKVLVSSIVLWNQRPRYKKIEGTGSGVDGIHLLSLPFCSAGTLNVLCELITCKNKQTFPRQVSEKEQVNTRFALQVIQYMQHQRKRHNFHRVENAGVTLLSLLPFVMHRECIAVQKKFHSFSLCGANMTSLKTKLSLTCILK